MTSLRTRFPNPILAALHPGILPGGVSRVLLVGAWSSAARELLAQVRRGFPEARICLLTSAPLPVQAGVAEVWIGERTAPDVLARARQARIDLIVPLEPYGLAGDTRPELESFALAAGARAVAVHEATYGTVRIATRSHLRYRLYGRPWVCRAFGAATLLLVVAPLYLAYRAACRLGLWRGDPTADSSMRVNP
jgi:hypothetical protein